MAISYVTSTTGGTANSNVDTAFTASTPSSTPADLILCWVNATNGTGTAPVITAPAGWTAVGSSIVDGSAPQLTANLYYRLVQGGDTTSPVWSFSTGSNATYVMAAYSGVDIITPITNVSVAAYAGTTGAKVTASVTTTTNGWIVSGFGDRSGGGYSANTDTFRGQSVHSSATASWLQDSNGNVSPGSQSRTVTGPSTSVGSSFILRLEPLATGGSAANADAGAGSGVAYPAVPLASPLKEWMKDKGSMYVAHRGGSADFVEHTMAAYQATDALHIQAMEISTWRTSDGVWVASHDRDTARMFGTSLDITANTWASLSSLMTTNGGYPMAKVTDILDAFNDQHVWFIENKQNINITSFLDMLDAYPNATGRFVIKAVYNSGSNPATSTVAAGRLRGYRSWGYYYEPDLASLDTSYENFDLLGMDYTASVSAWNQILAKPRPVLAHVCLSVAAVNQGFARGAAGVMVGKVLGGTPNAPASVASGSGSAFDAAVASSSQANALAVTALASGVAFDAIGSVPVFAPADVALGTGVALDVSVTSSGVLAPADTALADGQALDATVQVLDLALNFRFTSPIRTEVYPVQSGQGVRLWRRMHTDIGYSVLRFGNSYQMIVEPSTEQIESADAVFIGGRVYAINATEAAQLTTAGYGAYVSSAE